LSQNLHGQRTGEEVAGDVQRLKGRARAERAWKVTGEIVGGEIQLEESGAEVGECRRNRAMEVVGSKVDELERTKRERRKLTGELVTGDVEVEESLARRESACNVAKVFVGREVQVFQRGTLAQGRNSDGEVVGGKVQVPQRSGSGEVSISCDFVPFECQVFDVGVEKPEHDAGTRNLVVGEVDNTEVVEFPVGGVKLEKVTRKVERLKV